MTSTPEQRLKDLGLTLPEAAAPAANYVSSVQTENQLFISGQIPMHEGAIAHIGKLGDTTTIEEGYKAAQLCALSLIAQAKFAVGDLARVKRVVKLVGFVNSAPDFGDQPKVINGASDLMVQVFGAAGGHARSAIGVAALPFGVAVEVEAILEIASSGA